MVKKFDMINQRTQRAIKLCCKCRDYTYEAWIYIYIYYMRTHTHNITIYFLVTSYD